MDTRVEKLAELLVHYSVEVKPEQKVLIRGESLAEPLIKAVYREVLQVGGYPFVSVELPGMDELFYRYAADHQLQFVPPPLKLLFETYDVQISIMGASNTKALSRVDPRKTVLRQQAYRDLMKTVLSRAAKKELRWTVTLFPTNAAAQDAEMGLMDYEDFVYSACMPDLDDPVGYWRKVSEKQQKIIEWLQDKREVRVLAPETDLRLSIAGRTFINCDCHENVPDGEIFTGPVEDSVEGQVYFSYPAIYGGREVTGVRLWFEKGRVIKASAEKNEEFLLATLDTDAGARYVGEFAIGTNSGITQFTREILFDEKIAGSFHMALGAGYPESGSKNESSVHWDMICDLRQDGEIWVDGELFYKNGQFAFNPED